MKLRLASRYSLVVISIVLAVAAVMSTLLFNQFHKAADEFSQASAELIEANLETQFLAKGASVIQPLSLNLVNPLYLMDMNSLGQLLHIALQQPDVQNVQLFDPEGKLVYSGNNGIAEFGHAIASPELLKQLQETRTFIVMQEDAPMVLVSPVWLGSQLLGGVRVELDTYTIGQQREASDARMNAIRNDSFTQGLYLTVESVVLLLLLGGIITYFSSRLISYPMIKLSDFAKRLGKGDYSNPPNLDSQDEMGELTRIIAETAQRLQQTTVSRDFLDNIIDSMEEALLVTDVDQNITLANVKTCKLLNVSESKTLNLTLQDILPITASEEFSPLQLTPRNQVIFTETYLQTQDQDQQQIPVDMTLTALFHDDAPCQYLVVAQDISERKHAEAIIQHQAHYDELTNLPNRRLLLDRLQRDLARAQRHQHCGALLFIDLDQFKHINDSLGHSAGDLLLRQVASRLADQVRDEDTVARLGGDEFVVVLPELADNKEQCAEEARVVAEKLRECISQEMDILGHTLQITPSIGIAIFPSVQNSPDALLKYADTAMYRAKDNGRNSISFFSSDMQRAAEQRLQMQRDLNQAISNEEFVLYAQPLISAQGDTIAAELLLRWQHPQQGLLTPYHFIGLAEETGQILAMGEWVIRESCRVLATMQQAPETYSELAYLSVNVSQRQFQHPDFGILVERILEETRAPAHRLTLELTESMLMSNVDDAIGKMKRLKQLGVKFAIDDFGTGYSSLSYLHRLPLDIIKIDRSFVNDAIDNHISTQVIATIIKLSRDLGLTVVAEGVELESQYAMLQRFQCPMYQGYFFSKPIPLPALIGPSQQPQIDLALPD